MLKRKTVRIGDVFQILTAEGVCYGQVINTHPTFRFTVAIFREFFDEAPEDFEAVVSKEPQFITAFLVQSMVRGRFFQLVANVPVHPRHREFPIFRGTNNLGSGERTIWWFWDGEEEWKIGRPLTEKEKRYPRKGLPSAPLLIKEIEDDYRVEKDYI